MNRCSYFIQNKALFGSYPTQESVLELEEHGVRYFVDLTHNGEKNTTPYETKYKYIRFRYETTIPRQIGKHSLNLFYAFVAL